MLFMTSCEDVNSCWEFKCTYSSVTVETYFYGTKSEAELLKDELEAEDFDVKYSKSSKSESDCVNEY